MNAFAGDKKVGESIVTRLEKRFVASYVHRIPTLIETYHLTLCTVFWSIGLVSFGYLSGSDIRWIWGCNLMIIGQYLTDLFDGSLGRYRNTGLIKWGFFMDHFLDFIFSFCIVITYALMAPDGQEIYFLAFLLCSGCFMVISFLSFAATNEFEIYHFGMGPTEIRIGYILMNTIIYFFGVEIFNFWVPIILALNVLGISIMAYKTHRKLWKIDMDLKHRSSTLS